MAALLRMRTLLRQYIARQDMEARTEFLYAASQGDAAKVQQVQSLLRISNLRPGAHCWPGCAADCFYVTFFQQVQWWRQVQRCPCTVKQTLTTPGGHRSRTDYPPCQRPTPTARTCPNTLFLYMCPTYCAGPM